MFPPTLLSRASAALLIALLALAWPAGAETRRLAIVVGNNDGAQDRPPLRYAEADAERTARLLVEIGGVAADDLTLLRGGSVEALQDAVRETRRKVERWHRDPSARIVLLFYFSGHSDGEVLELGSSQLPFVQLRRWLDGTGADVQLTVVDSCRSGALLGVKGGTLRRAPDIRLVDDLEARGHAILTSSTADEAALESRALQGSFFTHFLLSGLRGAADLSGDGKVTLAEAYQYAFARTVAATSATLIGPQHPSFDYKLSGQGELVLSDLARAAATLELPAAFERGEIIDRARGVLLVELPSSGVQRLAVPAGDLEVRLWKDGKAYDVRLRLASGEARALRWEELALASAPWAQAKGPSWRAPPEPPGAFAVEVGAAGAFADDVAPLGSLRLGWRRATASGALFSIDLSTGRGADFRETAALVFAGYRLGTDLGPVRFFVAGQVGAGAVQQAVDGGATLASGALALSPGVGVEVRLTGALALAAEAQWPLVVVRSGGVFVPTSLPATWLGLVLAR